MQLIDIIDETICAQITAQGPAGVAILRVSGAKSLEIVRKLCSFLPPAPHSHHVYYGYLKDLTGQSVDEVLVTYFEQGRSFTGEETIEISCHGGFSAPHRILRELTQLGARPAERGEFTFRAFYKGRLDLVQAEGVLTMIESQSETSRKLALQQLQGKLSHEFLHIEDALLNVLAQLEASIDFSTEDIEPYSLDQIAQAIHRILDEVTQLVESYQSGKILKDGLRVVIAGPANAGKSSLYNRLVGENRAIVTDVAGTTRDILETRLMMGGIEIRLFDSAGLRETSDRVEKIGIAKSEEAVGEADLVLFVLDSQIENEYSPGTIDPSKTILVMNKVDQGGPPKDNLIKQSGDYSIFYSVCDISAEKNVNIQTLESLIIKFCSAHIKQSDHLISQFRHYDHLKKAQESLKRAAIQVKNQGSYDLIALDVQTSLKEIMTLLGKEFDEQVIDRIFSQFCLGK